MKNKNIVLGISGGIAAYKSVELLRLLKKAGSGVRVIMTKSAMNFVGALTFEALSEQPVCTDLFENNTDASIRHIAWAEEADLVVIAPATANIIGKFASGVADDALSTFILAVTSPILICPSMNTHMWENKAVQYNLDILRNRAYNIMEPDSGRLACGTTGPGRLPDAKYIFDRLCNLISPKDLAGKKIMVTAGPTLEPMDPVRFISNPSSGKMGYAIARAAEYRGAEVTLISGPVLLEGPQNVNLIRVQTAQEMADAVYNFFDNSDIVIKAAAVADYRVDKPACQKIKKHDNEIVLHLLKNQDILKELGKRKKHQILVGFAAETESLIQNAEKKLAEKNLDMIVGNLIGPCDSGFNVETNRVTLFYKDGARESLPLMSKDEVAHKILDKVKKLIKN
ncbi:Phosphopantothenoylcysteine decarboxylase / Phosphopantothenate--cysteine ligase [Candidatus Magnetomoraceae bacterium gMMP-1]